MPNSSSMIKDRLVACCKIWPTDEVSAVGLLLLLLARQRILSTRPIYAKLAGTKLPICARNTIIPTLPDYQDKDKNFG